MNTKHFSARPIDGLPQQEFHIKMEFLAHKLRVELARYVKKLREYFSGLVAG
jgi:hypothetical protein